MIGGGHTASGSAHDIEAKLPRSSQETCAAWSM